MMREVMRRRFGRLVKDEEEGTEEVVRPDLLLIDGGAGQLAEVLAVLADLGLDDITAVGVAKGPDRDAGMERFFMPGKPPFMLPLKSPALYYIQRLRDEAHRFANGAHATRRSMDIKKNPLDEIEGVGPGRKKALLHAFGSAKGVRPRRGGRSGQGRRDQPAAGRTDPRLLQESVTLTIRGV